MDYVISVGNFIVYENDGKTPLETYSNRCLSASIGGKGIESNTIPWEGTKYNPWDYKYENENFILDPIRIPKPAPIISQEERNVANIDYLSMMIGVDLPEKSDIKKSRFEKIKSYYSRGLWTRHMVETSVTKKWITPEEFVEMGELYDNSTRI